jgi:membrane fusion protein (multidrug efflux system)
VVAAQQLLKTALTNLTYSNIYAPFDGTIGISQVRLGNLVTPGTTLLNTISTDNPMGVDVLVNEAQLAHFEDLQRNKQNTVDSLFTIILPNQQVYPYLGKIAIIDRAVDPQTGTITVRLAFPNPKYDLRPGMSVVVRVHNQDAGPQIVVPSRAVVEQMGEYFLFIAKDTVLETHSADSAAKKGADTVQTAKLRAFQKKVQLGQTIGPNVVVKSGVNVGDRVIVDGVQAIHEGSAINASSKPSPGKNENTGNQERDSSKNK